MDSYVEWDKGSLNYWPFQGRKTKMHAQHLPDATIAMQPLFFPGFMLYWDVPNVSLPRNATAQNRANPGSESRSMLVFSPYPGTLHQEEYSSHQLSASIESTKYPSTRG